MKVRVKKAEAGRKNATRGVRGGGKVTKKIGERRDRKVGSRAR